MRMRHGCMTSWMMMLLHLKGIIGKMSLIDQEHNLGEALRVIFRLVNMMALQPTTTGTSVEMSTEYTQEEVSTSKMGSGKEL
ncbi:hypothetical protein R6Q59_010308 [Mikania micrantha]